MVKVPIQIIINNVTNITLQCNDLNDMEFKYKQVSDFLILESDCLCVLDSYETEGKLY